MPWETYVTTIRFISEQATIPFDLYNDDAFKNMIDQLHHRQLEGYEFLVESMNVSIYRRPKVWEELFLKMCSFRQTHRFHFSTFLCFVVRQGKNGLFEYKLYAVLPHATPKMLTTVFLDSKYRVEWDEYVTGYNKQLLNVFCSYS